MKKFLTVALFVIPFAIFAQNNIPEPLKYKNVTIILENDTLTNQNIDLYIYNDHYVIRSNSIGIRTYYTNFTIENNQKIYSKDSANLKLNKNKLYYKFNNTKIYN